MSYYKNILYCYSCNAEIHPADAITPDDIRQFCSTYCHTAWKDEEPAEEELENL